MEKQEQFNPYDAKYKKVADLPEDQQQNFADTQSGGFVKKEVLESDEEFKRVSFIDVAHGSALEEDDQVEAEKTKFLKSTMQESYDLNLINGYPPYDQSDKIKSIAQELGVNIQISPEILQKNYERVLEEGEVSSAEEAVEFANERNIKLETTLKEAVQMLYKGRMLNPSDFGGYEYIKVDIKRIADFAQKHGLNFKPEIPDKEAWQEAYERFLGKDIGKAKMLVEFAQKQGIKLEISEAALKKGFEGKLFSIYGHERDEFDRFYEFAQVNGIELEIPQEILQKGYELSLKDGDCKTAKIISDFALQQKGIIVKTTREVLQEGYMAAFGYNDMYKVKDVADFAKEQGVELDMEKAIQKGAEILLGREEGYNGINEVLSYGQKHGVEVKLKNSLEIEAYVRSIHGQGLSHVESSRKGLLKRLKASGSSLTYEDVVKMDYLDYLDIPKEQRMDKKIEIQIGDQSVVAVFHGQRKDEPVQGKFIVGITSEKKLEFVFDGTLGEHKDIGAKYDLQVIGGGWLEIDEQNKKVKIYGKSQDFGYEPRSISKQAVAEAFPEYEVIEEK